MKKPNIFNTSVYESPPSLPRPPPKYIALVSFLFYYESGKVWRGLHFYSSTYGAALMASQPNECGSRGWALGRAPTPGAEFHHSKCSYSIAFKHQFITGRPPLGEILYLSTPAQIPSLNLNKSIVRKVPTQYFLGENYEHVQ